MSSWINKTVVKNKQIYSPVIPESILNNTINNTDIKNIELTYGFDITYYRYFNDNVSNLNEHEIYNHFINICIPNNVSLSDYDYIINDNFETDEASIKNKNMIINHYYIRTIKSYSELISYRNTLRKNYIYNKNTLYSYYYDLDLNFYRNKYLNDDKTISDFDIYLHYHRNKQNLRNNKQLIVIYSPPYDINVGGIVVMHNLCKIINEKFGNMYKAKLFMHNNIRYRNPFCNEFASLDEINNNTIVIYPEIIYGNPLNAKIVIRWILLNLGIEMPKNHYINWNVTDYVYYWEPIYKKQLCYPFINPIFKNKHLKRTTTCFLIKKGRLIHKNINYIHNSDSVEIDNLSLSQISDIFNTSKYFYCYDPYSLFAIYAAMCGCVTIVYPILNVTEEEYFDRLIYNYKNTLYNKGIVYGYSEAKIEKALDEINSCDTYYVNLMNLYKTTVHEFIEDIDNIVLRTNLDNTVKNIFIK
jgi:hypothetical protein